MDISSLSVRPKNEWTNTTALIFILYISFLISEERAFQNILPKMMMLQFLQWAADNIYKVQKHNERPTKIYTTKVD